MIQVWGLTDNGLVRKDNQDAYGITEKTENGYNLISLMAVTVGEYN